MTKTVVFIGIRQQFPAGSTKMKSASFDDLAQQLIDVWISREVDRPAILGRMAGEQLSANMVLAVIEMTDSNAEIRVNLLRDYSIPTSYGDVAEVLISRLPLLPGGRLHPSIQGAIAGRRPSLISETVRHDNLQTNFEMLSLPQKTEKPGGDWCLVLGVVNYILRSSAVPKDLDDIDLAILQLLREGLQMRGIGQRVELSPRTVEHRVERLKALTGARTLHDLVARSL
ncbi:winged helix-turn-helix transcriptional regulator [Rhizobium sp. CBK13]|uniref:winged helix-turn-helix transcriptional regulator n=1 Tax=Rhizobium sp. CBK13 TaxID=3031399 RepID=UPI0023AEC4AE|nr:winged helix-turn-helix transcriptional regulator [Rhizobium sp. CBK13]MDE8762577.1 winged helix-turn-helix transcriptional regulator [Rhizobium sp. CBK13]